MKRLGLVTLCRPVAPLTSLFGFEAAGPYLVGAVLDQIISIGIGGAITTIKTGLTPDKPWSFVQQPIVGGEGPLFAMNGVDPPQQWDGVAAGMNAWTAAVGSVPNGTMGIVHQNSIFVAGTAANPSRLYWSQPGDPTNWPAANVVDLDPNDGEAITGLGLVGPYLLVGKAHKLFVVTSADTGANRRLSDVVGVASHRSIASGPAGTFFLSAERGVYLTNGSKLTVLSDDIQPTIDSIVAGERSEAAGTFYRGHYYLSVSDDGVTNDKTLDYDSTLGSWWLHDISSNQFTLWRDNLYSAKGSALGGVDECFVPGVFTDNGNPIHWVWRGPWQSPSFYRRRRFPTPYFRKRLRQLRLEGQGAVDVSLAKDFAATETLIRPNVFAVTGDAFAGVGTFGGGGIFADAPPLRSERVYSLGVALAFSLVFSATSTTPDELDLYALMIHDRVDGVG